MSKLTIVAHITAEPESIELVKAELLRLVEITRAEEGCLQYDLHQDNDAPAHFTFYENWETREHWLAHMDQAHIRAFSAATEGAVADFHFHEMTLVEDRPERNASE